MNIEALIAVYDRNIAAWEAILKQAESEPEMGPLAARAIEQTRDLIARTRKVNEGLRAGKFYS